MCAPAKPICDLDIFAAVVEVVTRRARGQHAADALERERIWLLEPGQMRWVVAVERVARPEVGEHLLPLHGVGVAQAQHSMAPAELRNQAQRALEETDGGVAKLGDELPRRERQLVSLHDQLGELELARATGFERADQFGPMGADFLAAPATSSAARARDQAGALKVIEDAAHVEYHHAITVQIRHDRRLAEHAEVRAAMRNPALATRTGSQWSRSRQVLPVGRRQAGQKSRRAVNAQIELLKRGSARCSATCYTSRPKMSNPHNYAIVKAPAKDRSRGVPGTSLNLRKRGAANWSLSVPDASFDSGDNTWEETLVATVKKSGESVQFPAEALARLRAEANRIMHPTVKNRLDRD